ncbi:MAG: YceH family protein [Pseudomonadota bacterium]|nr:YceH family protein [Pseudomonadota bacterium]
MLPLTAAEARVLGVLIEKSKTTPDAYPLTVNSLAAGCNQKTSRDPVMNLSEAEVQATLEDLRGRTLIMESYGASGRVLRYAHNFGKVYGLPAAAVDLLAVLILRGPQTASELRANCERLHHFADASAVEGYLDELASREAGALTLKLPRQPGAREQRWAHLVCGEPVVMPVVAPLVTSDLEERVARLEQIVAELRALVAPASSRLP